MANKRIQDLTLAGALQSTDLFEIEQTAGSRRVTLASVASYMTSNTFTGTANRITITAGNINIASNYEGQNTITKLGVVTTGTWNATTVAHDYGGTGQTTYAKGNLLVGLASGALTKLTPGANDRVLTTDSSTLSGLKWAAPVVSLTATYVGFGDGSNLLTGDSGLTYDSSNKSLLLGTASPIAIRGFDIARSVNNSMGISITNPFSGSTSAEMIFGEDGSNFGVLQRLNSASAGNITGTSIPTASTIRLVNLASGMIGVAPVINQGSPIYNVVGTTGSNYGSVSTTTGLRIDTIANLHTSNSNAFTVNGSSYLGGNAAATALLHMAAGTGSANSAPLKLTSGTLNTTAEAGAREYNNSFYDTKNSGLRYGAGGVIFNQFSTTGNGTTVETDISTYTTPASTFAANGETIEFLFSGSLLNSVTASRRLRLYFGGSSLFDSGALTVLAASYYNIWGTITRVNSTTIRYSLSFDYGGITASTVFVYYAEVGSFTLSNTNILKITGQAAGAGAASNDITCDHAKLSWFAAANN